MGRRLSLSSTSAMRAHAFAVCPLALADLGRNLWLGKKVNLEKIETGAAVSAKLWVSASQG